MALPSMLAAQTAPKLEYVYEEHLGGVYTQSWSVILLGQSRDRVATDVYVVGDGKNGDFFGVIAVNCATPSRSRWLAVGVLSIANRCRHKQLPRCVTWPARGSYCVWIPSSIRWKIIGGVSQFVWSKANGRTSQIFVLVELG